MTINAFGQPVGDPVDHRPAREPEPCVLTGRLVRLEPMSAAHAPGLLELGRHPELWTYSADHPPRDDDDARALAAPRPGWLTWAILRDDRMLGRISLLRAQPDIGTIEVGRIVYAPELQRTRAATEVQHLVAEYAFSLGYRRYEWKCDSLNEPSRRAALRLGFVEEGTWRHALVYKGRNRDTTWYSMTDDEWPAVAAAMREWLDDANFGGADSSEGDNGGEDSDDPNHRRQLRSLAEIRASHRRG